MFSVFVEDFSRLCFYQLSLVFYILLDEYLSVYIKIF